MLSLAGKICLVTGSSGRNIVQRFKAAQATIIAVDLDKSKDAEVDSVSCDLGDASALDSLDSYIKGKYGRIDCLINNGALGGHLSPVHQKSLKEYDDIMRVNVKGPFILSQIALKLHLADPQHLAKRLDILNITSGVAHSPVAEASAYAMSKAALLSLTRSIAKEYSGKSVRSLSVSPGIMESLNVQGFSENQRAQLAEGIPMGRAGRAEEVSNLLAWLASDEAPFINGTDILVDGGRRV